MEIFKIQLLARWSSTTVLHYAWSAPLVTITSEVARRKQQVQLDDLLELMSKDTNYFNDKLHELDGHTQSGLREEQNCAFS